MPACRRARATPVRRAKPPSSRFCRIAPTRWSLPWSATAAARAASTCRRRGEPGSHDEHAHRCGVQSPVGFTLRPKPLKRIQNRSPEDRLTDVIRPRLARRVSLAGRTGLTAIAAHRRRPADSQGARALTPEGSSPQARGSSSLVRARCAASRPSRPSPRALGRSVATVSHRQIGSYLGRRHPPCVRRTPPLALAGLAPSLPPSSPWLERPAGPGRRARRPVRRGRRRSPPRPRARPRPQADPARPYAWFASAQHISAEAAADVVGSQLSARRRPALATVYSALGAGRHVVTCQQCAARPINGTELSVRLRGASAWCWPTRLAVAGGIRISRRCREGLARHPRSRGFFSSLTATCNFILTTCAVVPRLRRRSR